MQKNMIAFVLNDNKILHRYTTRKSLQETIYLLKNNYKLSASLKKRFFFVILETIDLLNY